MTTTDPAERLPGEKMLQALHEYCAEREAAAYQRGMADANASWDTAYQRGQTDERERLRAAMGVPLWHSTVPVAYFRADDVAAILDAGADR